MPISIPSPVRHLCAPRSHTKTCRARWTSVWCGVYSKCLLSAWTSLSILSGTKTRRPLVLYWRVIDRPTHGVSRQWPVVVRITARNMRQALACQAAADFWRQPAGLSCSTTTAGSWFQSPTILADNELSKQSHQFQEVIHREQNSLVPN